MPSFLRLLFWYLYFLSLSNFNTPIAVDMFPITSDGVFEGSSIFFEDDDKFLEDLLVDFPALESGNAVMRENGGKKRARKQKPSPSSEVQERNDGGGGGGSSDSKKTAHRVIEKQRRQEMSALYASLRSLLPIEYIKGKRAVSDHMHQAANYINDMKKKIEEMKARRDGLMMNSSNSLAEARTHASLDPSNSTCCVKVNQIEEGLEILISSSSINKEGLPLSRVLADLAGRDLNVINCVSSRGDRCFLHKIQIELDDSTRIDLSELQEGVVNSIKYS